MNASQTIWGKFVSASMAILLIVTTSLPVKPVHAEDIPITPGLIFSANQETPADRYEIMSKRTPASRTYETTIGEYTTEVYAEPISYRDTNGNLQDINNTLIAKDPQNTQYENTANSFRALLPNTLTPNTPITFEHNQTQITLMPVEGTYTQGTVSDNAIKFTNVATGTTANITVENTGIRHDLILNTAPGTPQYTYALTTQNLNLITHQGAVFALDPATQTSAATLTATAQDAAGHVCTDVTTTYHSGTNTLSVSLNPGWLNAPPHSPTQQKTISPPSKPPTATPSPPPTTKWADSKPSPTPEAA